MTEKTPIVYRCIKEHDVPYADEDGDITDDFETIPLGSLWTLQNMKYTLTGADLRLETVEDLHPLQWIEISKETLKECFEEVLDAAD